MAAPFAWRAHPGEAVRSLFFYPFTMSRTAILLVEDDPNLGNLLAEYLRAKDYDVTLATDGKAGWEAYSKGRFDLLVLDVMMPLKDGFTLAREIRAKDSATPIVFLTAR